MLTPISVQAVLEDIDLGEDVAENDKGLQEHFVETGSFEDVIGDRCDLVLGPKGSGKSAIFRRLASSTATPIPELADVDVVPAFNLTGSPIFQKLSALAQMPDEFQMRFIWWTYAVSLVGNHIVATFPKSDDVKALDGLLRQARLKTASAKPESVWSAITDTARRIVLPTSLEATLSFTGVSAKAEFERPARKAAAVPSLDLETVVRLEDEILSQAKKRCWLAFDRLDESFTGSPELERVALRALLRTHLELSSYRVRVRTKLFLRDDVMSQVTKDSGFTNLSHMRPLRIVWEPDDVAELVARRVGASTVFCTAFGLLPDPPRGQVLRHLLPSEIRRRPGLEWIIENTTDGSASPNPRNVLSLVREARKRQIAAARRERTQSSPRKALLAAKTLVAAHRDVSERRLDDTLFAERNDLRPWVERFAYHKLGAYRRSVLAELFGFDTNTPELQRTIVTLTEAGFLLRLSPERWAVAPLYRPALHITEPQEPANKKAATKQGLVEHEVRTRTAAKPPARSTTAPASVTKIAIEIAREAEKRRSAEEQRRRSAVARQVEVLEARIAELRADVRDFAGKRPEAATRLDSARMTVQMLRNSLQEVTDPTAAAPVGKALGNALETQRGAAADLSDTEMKLRRAQRSLQLVEKEARALRSVLK